MLLCNSSSRTCTPLQSRSASCRPLDIRKFHIPSRSRGTLLVRSESASHASAGSPLDKLWKEAVVLGAKASPDEYVSSRLLAPPLCRLHLSVVQLAVAAALTPTLFTAGSTSPPRGHHSMMNTSLEWSCSISSTCCSQLSLCCCVQPVTWQRLCCLACCLSI